MHISVESSYLLYLKKTVYNKKKEKEKKQNKVTSGYMPNSPGALHTLPVGFSKISVKVENCTRSYLLSVVGIIVHV